MQRTQPHANVRLQLSTVSDAMLNTCRALAAIPLLCVSTGKCIVVHRVRFFKDQRNET